MFKKLILLIILTFTYLISTSTYAVAAYIAVDPGHGGSDPGATGNGLKESDINLKIALKLNELMVSSGLHKTIMTRTQDTFVSLSKRVETANNAKTDIFVSIHNNSAASTSAAGAEVLYQTDSEKGKSLANLVQEELVKSTGARDRGIKARGDLYVLNNTLMPAIIVESGFISNSSEAKKLATADYQQKIALGVFNGINRYFGVTPALKINKPYVTVNPFSPNGDKYRDLTGISYNLTMDARVTVKVLKNGTLIKNVIGGKPRKRGATYYEIWDGKDSKGRIAGDGIYDYRIIAKTPYRRSVARGTVELANKPLVSSPYTTVNPFSPDGDGFKDITGFSYFLNASSKVLVKVYSGSKLIATPVINQPRTAGKRYYEIWNGTDDSGKIVGEGEYRYRIIATNKFGRSVAKGSVISK